MHSFPLIWQQIHISASCLGQFFIEKNLWPETAKLDLVTFGITFSTEQVWTTSGPFNRLKWPSKSTSKRRLSPQNHNPHECLQTVTAAHNSGSNLITCNYKLSLTRKQDQCGSESSSKSHCVAFFPSDRRTATQSLVLVLPAVFRSV